MKLSEVAPYHFQLLQLELVKPTLAQWISLTQMMSLSGQKNTRNLWPVTSSNSFHFPNLNTIQDSQLSKHLRKYPANFFVSWRETILFLSKFMMPKREKSNPSLQIRNQSKVKMIRKKHPNSSKNLKKSLSTSVWKWATNIFRSKILLKTKALQNTILNYSHQILKILHTKTNFTHLQLKNRSLIIMIHMPDKIFHKHQKVDNYWLHRQKDMDIFHQSIIINL